jgi:hypothetical protein
VTAVVGSLAPLFLAFLITSCQLRKAEVYCIRGRCHAPPASLREKLHLAEKLKVA